MSRYQEAYKLENITGPGDGRPTAMQIVKDEKLEGALGDKVMLVTGTYSGLGVPTARALAATGALVFLGVRDIAKAEKVHADILSPKVQLLQVDMSNLESVRRAGKELLERSEGRLNIIINNAGTLAPPEFHTGEGFESQMAVYYWGPFLFFHLVKDALISSSTPRFPSRVVNVSSKGHQYEQIDLADLHFSGKKSILEGYGRSKLAQVYMASEIERRYGQHNLHAFSLDPGVAKEGSALDRYAVDMFADMWHHPVILRSLQSRDQGAATTIWATLSSEALNPGTRGRYVEKCAVSGPMEVGGEPGIAVGYAEWAYDEEVSKQLWDASFEVVGLPKPKELK